MPSTPFDARDAKLSGAIDKAFGENFTFIAKKTAAADVDLPLVADGARASFDAVGAFENPAKRATPTARGSIQDDNAHSWDVSMPSVSVDDSLLTWRPVRGDRVTRAFNGTKYEIARAFPDGMGRTVFFLTNAR